MKIWGNGEDCSSWLESGALSWTSYSMALMGYRADVVAMVVDAITIDVAIVEAMLVVATMDKLMSEA